MRQLLALGFQVGEVVVEAGADIRDKPELSQAPGDDVPGQWPEVEREPDGMPVLVSAEREAIDPWTEAGKGGVWGEVRK